MVIKLSIEVEEVITGGEGCGGSKKQLENEFESYFDSAIINGYKVIDCKVINAPKTDSNQINLTFNIKCPIPDESTLGYPPEEFKDNLLDHIRDDITETLLAQLDVKADVNEV